jgi:geranylgeranyl diphosphate synthase type II
VDIQKYILKQSKKIEKELSRVLPRENEHPARLSQAMRYAVFSGGKRMRPIFALEACRALSGRQENVMPAALALELIHSYSLAHDDLPCMDNDLSRRGKPSCHAKFGEVTALLAGDALLTLAFEVLCFKKKDSKNLTAIQWIAQAIGHQGMVGGQALDMECQGKEMDLPTVEYINTHKSGALIAVSTRVGAFLGGGSPKEIETLYRYGKNVGLLFQVVDDIIDKQGYFQVIGARQAREETKRLLETAKNVLAPLKSRGRILSDLADFVANRKS